MKTLSYSSLFVQKVSAVVQAVFVAHQQAHVLSAGKDFFVEHVVKVTNKISLVQDVYQKEARAIQMCSLFTLSCTLQLIPCCLSLSQTQRS